MTQVDACYNADQLSQIGHHNGLQLATAGQQNNVGIKNIFFFFFFQQKLWLRCWDVVKKKQTNDKTPRCTKFSFVALLCIKKLRQNHSLQTRKKSFKTNTFCNCKIYIAFMNTIKQVLNEKDLTLNFSKYFHCCTEVTTLEISL